MLDPKHCVNALKPQVEAENLPPWCYTDESFHRIEIERVFMKVWNYVGHESRIPEPGDFFTVEITGAPVIIIRGDDGEIRAFHNSCRHRGSRIASGDGNCKALTCPYHTWTYGRDGKLLATPMIEEDEHLRQ